MTDIPVGKVKLANIADGYAEVAMVEETLPDMRLSPIITPTIQLREKPAPARTGYLPGAIGAQVAAVALNFSSVGLFNREDLSRLILEVYAVMVTNPTGSVVAFNIRRDDEPVQVGMTFTAWNTAYSDAGSVAQPAIGRNTDSTETSAPGDEICRFSVGSDSSIILPFGGIINNGQFLITPTVVNTAVHAAFFFRAFPILQEQRPGA